MRGLKFIYKFSNGDHKEIEFNIQPAAVAMEAKKPVKRVWLSRKSKRENENINDGYGTGEEKRGGRQEEEEGGGGKTVVVKGRKSVSQVEVNLESAAEFLQVRVLVSDMPGFMQLLAFRCARTTYDSLENFSSRHIAFNIKKEFDKVYGPAWHCIVGSNFGSFVTHSTGCFLYFSMEKLHILLFKTKIQKALK